MRCYGQHAPTEGWWLKMPEPGVLVWRTPAGRTYVTKPPPATRVAALRGEWPPTWRATALRFGRALRPVEEVPVVTGPGDEMAGGAAGRGRMRASYADREQVIELLKDAFVQGRLTRHELDSRVGRALASRTYADLAALTADVPAGSAAAEPAAKPAAKPAGTPARTLAKAARRSGICMLVAFALMGVMALTNAADLLPLAFFSGVAAVIAASGFLGYGVVDAWQERRSRGQLPPGPRHGGQVLEGQRDAAIGHDTALPDAVPDETRTDLRTHRSRPSRPRGLWSVQGAA